MRTIHVNLDEAVKEDSDQGRRAGQNCRKIRSEFPEPTPDTTWHKGMRRVQNRFLDFAPKYICVEELDPNGVWLVKLPVMPLNRSAALDERRSMLRTFTEKWRHTALWLSDIYNRTGALWSFPPPSELPSIVDPLDEGGWAVMFFDEQPESVLPEYTRVPSKPKDVTKMLAELRASAAIISWYDDTEWIVAFRCPVAGGTTN